jgi:LuxR family transcriptional regulator, maltose regulon positive regulatory protein
MPAATPTPVRRRRRTPSSPADAHGPASRSRGPLPRPRLVKHLTGAGEGAVVVLIAPPGYGKTTLLREWSEWDSRPFVWLDGGTLESRGAVGSYLAALAEPAAAQSGLVVAVDDAHLVPPAVLSDLVEAALLRLPAHGTLALASRTEPALPLGRLRAHRRLVELREEHLALNRAETERVLSDGGIDLPADAVDAIAGRTEGWAAAVYLSTLSLAADGDAAQRATGFGGDDHLVSEYLHDEVLSALSPAVLRFMARSSMVHELSGPVCDAVLERDGSARLLAGVARANLFLRALDPAHERFRWHPMFREALEAELRRTEPELIPELHRRASIWLYDHADIDGAIDHAVAGGDLARTGDLLSRNVVAYVGHGRAGIVRGWLEDVPAERIAADPRLALVAAHAALAQGDANQAQRWRLSAADGDGAGPGPEAASRQAAIALIEAMSPRAPMTTIEACSSAAYEAEGEGGAWRPLACLLRGVASHLRGDREAAIEFLEEGIQDGRDTAPAIAALCCAQRAMIAIELCDWDTAAELTDLAVAEAGEHHFAGEPVSALVFAAAAAVRARAGRADEAKGDLRRGVDLLAELGGYVPWYGAETRILLAHASLGLADVLRARTLLAEASRCTRRCPDARIFTQWFEDAWAHIDTLAETSLSGPSSLTIAELRILRFLPSHRSFKEIAGQLGVSANTVKTQAHAVYRKLGAASRSEAVTRASRAGLLGQ